ncbi:MAG: cupin domain-containing protein [Gemmatimonadota bacterium]
MIPLIRKALCVLGLTLAIGVQVQSQQVPAAPQAQPTLPPLRSMVFPKDSGRSRSLASNQRSLVDTATAILKKLEIHESTLKPGANSHAPHRHAHEEVIVMYQGDVEILQGDRWRKAHGGDVVFLASNEWHNFTNIGTVDAKYLVIRIDTNDQGKDLPSNPQPTLPPKP